MFALVVNFKKQVVYISGCIKNKNVIVLLAKCWLKICWDYDEKKMVDGLKIVFEFPT